MKINKIKEMSSPELEKELGELKTELFKLKFSLATIGLKDHSKIKSVKKDIARITLKNTKIYLVILVILSIGISYLTFLISMNIKYSIDSILFNNYNDIPQYLNIIFNQNYIHDLLILCYYVSFCILLLFLHNFLLSSH